MTVIAQSVAGSVRPPGSCCGGLYTAAQESCRSAVCSDRLTSAMDCNLGLDTNVTYPDRELIHDGILEKERSRVLTIPLPCPIG